MNNFYLVTLMKDHHTTNSHYLTCTFSRGWENVLFELGNERVSPLVQENEPITALVLTLTNSETCNRVYCPKIVNAHKKFLFFSKQL